MRSQKFYLALLLTCLCFVFVTHARELSMNVECYEEMGRIVKKDNKTFFYINFEASSERSFEISNPEALEGSLSRLSSYNALVKFKVLADCDFQCNAQLIDAKLVRPWEKIKPVVTPRFCK